MNDSYEQQSSQQGAPQNQMQPPYAQTWNPSNSPQQRPYSPIGQQAYRAPPPPNAVSFLVSMFIYICH